jgi:hypothetical protein
MGSSVRSDTSTEVSPLQRAAVSKLMDSYRSSVGPLGQPISGVVRLANMSDVEME